MSTFCSSVTLAFAVSGTGEDVSAMTMASGDKVQRPPFHEASEVREQGCSRGQVECTHPFSTKIMSAAGLAK